MDANRGIMGIMGEVCLSFGFFLASNYKNSFRELFIRIVSLADYQIYVLGEYSLESQSSE